MPVIYSIDGNDVLRDGELVARINADHMIDFMSDEIASRYAGVISKFLAEEERYNRETGEAVYLVPECEPEPESPPPEPQPEPERTTPAPDHAAPIGSIAELVEAVQPHAETAAPAFDRYFGEETPEVLRWLHAHGSIVNRIKQINGFTGALAARKDF